MKRVFAIAISFSILYAGAVWALNGCESLIAPVAAHSHGDSDVGHHPDGAHGHGPADADAGKIHCPNLFGEFLIGSQVSIGRSLRFSVPVTYDSVGVGFAAHELSIDGFALGPPGPVVSPHRSRHILLSVMRI